MPIKVTERMIAAAIAGFEAQKREIDAEIAALRGEARESAAAEPSADSTKPARRKMSAATRKKMALAQKKRWAGKMTPVSAPEAVAAKPKGKLRAAGKKRIIEASKRYWAAKKAAAKKAA